MSRIMASGICSSSRVPTAKAEWAAFEPKLRFRAFTVARLAQCDYIDAARQVLSNAVETGKGVAETYKQWQTLQTLVQDDAMKLRPGYWENVYRTNIQTAYTAGKLMQFRDRPPPAWRLLVIEDGRTSNICRGLAREGANGLALASDHPFWQKFGYPPYHFQCRTGLQAVFQAEIDNGAKVDNPDIKDVESRFAPMEGFGGNPLDSGNYWMMTKAMFERGLRYGVINEFNQLDNIVADFESLWKEYKREPVGKGWIDIHSAALKSKEFKNNYAAAKKLAAEGNYIKMLPEHKGKGISGWSNPDYLMNASLWELKTPKEFSVNSIQRAIRDGQKQSLNVIIDLPETADWDIVTTGIYKRFIHTKYPTRVKNLIVLHGKTKYQWTADQIKGWDMQ
ncbi:MAG: phage minor head protein [Treponema sp.]|nr:phage minor head protein [Treponema sp.]